MASSSRVPLFACASLGLLLSASAAALAQSGSTSRVTVTSSGDEVYWGGSAPSIAGDGSKICFTSFSDELVPGDTNHWDDVFVHDRTDGSVVRASVSSTGVEGNFASANGSLSADGRCVAFESAANNLVPNDNNFSRDIFVRDLVAGTTERVSVASSGAESFGNSSHPSLSSDGRLVLFESSASLLVPDDLNGQSDAFVHDRQTGATVRVSVNSNGREGNLQSAAGQISADGRIVAFASFADNLVSHDKNGSWDVFVRDLQTGQTSRASVSSSGAESTGVSFDPSISADGRFVAFHSVARTLVSGDTNGQIDCFVHDLSTGLTERVSVSSAGKQARAESINPALSADGRYVAFQSLSKDLVSVPTGKIWSVYLHDRQTGLTTLESVSSAGVTGELNSSAAGLSADGRYVCFTSAGIGIVPGDENGYMDVFVRDRIGCTATVSTYCTASATSVAGCMASMASTGAPSLAAGAGFTLSSGAIPGAGLGLLRFGVTGSSALPLGTLGGQLCVDTPSYALPPKATAGTLGACDGGLGYTLAEMIASQPGVILPGSTVHASFLLRDRANPDGFATSNGIWFQVCP
jgi:Tol biopolymer transport system component